MRSTPCSIRIAKAEVAEVAAVEGAVLTRFPGSAAVVLADAVAQAAVSEDAAARAAVLADAAAQAAEDANSDRSEGCLGCSYEPLY